MACESEGNDDKDVDVSQVDRTVWQAPSRLVAD